MQSVPLTLALILSVMAPLPALAWGSLGHRMIGEVAAKNFPGTIPAFLRTPQAVQRIGELAREPDRSRNAGEPHDADLDPAHFLDVSDDGTILSGPKLAALPANRLDFDTALRAAGSNGFKSGYLPYAMMEGWQQLVKDFTLWRADAAMAKLAKSPAGRQYFGGDRDLRQIITLRDLGFWAHFVGDASQPMHASIHYNGWGDGPNPEGFATGPGLHNKFETDFVNANIGEADVEAMVRPYRDCACTIQAHVQDYLAATQALVVQAYRFEKDGAYDHPTPQSKAFVTARVAEGAAMLRDLVVDAWRASGEASIGYREKITIADIEADKADPAAVLREMRD